MMKKGKSIKKRIKPKTIDKIKNNEKKYTVLMGIFFVALFVSISHYMFRLNDSRPDLTSDIDTNIEIAKIIGTGSTIILTQNNILSDEYGLKQLGNKFSFKNDTPNNIKYRVRLVEDKALTEECGCVNKTINYKDIKYSIDESTVRTFQNEKMIIDEGILNHDNTKTINLKIWIDEKYPQKDYHFHGHVSIEELSKK